MALVGNLSGSSLYNSIIGVTGSLLVANTTANFPVQASDTIFFVSGSKSGGAQAVFGGNVVMSGSAAVGTNLSVTGDATITGNLSVNGTTTYINTTNLLVKDPFVLLNSGSAGTDMGVVFGGGNSTNDVVLGINNKDGTLAAVTMDASSGSLTAIDAGILTKMYASNFMVGAGGAAVTSPVIGQLSGSGADVYLKSTGLLYLSGGNGQVSLAANGSEWSTFSTGFPGSSLIAAINAVSASASNTPQYFTSPSAGNLYTTGSTAFGITAAPSSIGSDVFFFVSGTINGNGTSKRSVFGGDTVVSGSLTVKSTMNVTGSIMPGADVTYNLGAANQRWANIYTGDLHLRNERGDWTVIEEEEYLSIRNNKTGKMYKFVLEAVN